MNNASFPLFTATTLVLAILKLSGSVDWSWWVVFSPVFIGLGIALVVFLVVALGGLLLFLLGRR